MKIAITDNRTVFTNTFSNYKKSTAIKEFINSIYYHKKEESYFWTAELLCSNCIIEIWDTYIEIMCKYTHIYNPKLPIYLHKKYGIQKRNIYAVFLLLVVLLIGIFPQILKKI